MCGPRSLRIRMWIGFWPPSRLTLRFDPEREPAPFWPRPEVFPRPEPSPRPIRFLRWREPGFGFRLCSPISSVSAIDSHQVRDLGQHAAGHVVVCLFTRAPDLPKAKRTKGVPLLRVGTVRRLHLGVLDRAHASTVSASGSGVSAGAPAGAPRSLRYKPRAPAVLRRR